MKPKPFSNYPISAWTFQRRKRALIYHELHKCEKVYRSGFNPIDQWTYRPIDLFSFSMLTFELKLCDNKVPTLEFC